MRSQWLDDDTMGHLLAALMPANRLALECSHRYGMRIGDVLALKTQDVEKGDFSYVEEKTGKRRRMHLTPDFQARLLRQSGRVYIFQGRSSWKRHRTRQAVYKDLKRIATAYRLRGISPHTARKVYAVKRYKACGDIRRVQRLLNHSDEAVTVLYALADELSERSQKWQE